MARKISFDAPVEAAGGQAKPEEAAPANRPLLGLDRRMRPTGALSAISRSLDGLSERARRADEIEQKMVQGLAVVEIDPALVDGSIVPDRMEPTAEQNEAFREAIRQHGQQSPILVRPKPGVEGHYEVAFGHRRLRAARELGIGVRAVVRKLTDEELVVAQGQENSSRTDLTYIERVRFAARLEERGFSRDVIMSALSVDKAALSKFISLAGRLPPDIVEAIGPAPGFGRQRWAELADMLATPELRNRARSIVQDPALRTADSDQRFLALHAAMRPKAAPRQAEPVIASDGSRIGEVSRSAGKLIVALDAKAAPEFGEFVRQRLAALYDEFRAAQDRPR